MSIVPTRPSESPKYLFALTFLTVQFNTDLKRKPNGLPKDAPLDEIYPSPKLYYRKLNSIYLRRKARELMQQTLDWTLDDAFGFFRYMLWKIKDQTFRTTAMYFMMYRYHEINADIGYLEVFRQWIRQGELQPAKMLDDFAEYCLLPLLNFSEGFRTALLPWADDPDKWVRRTAGVAVKKCAIDTDKVPFVLDLCLRLLKNCEETEVQSGIGQALLKVGKKRKHLLIPFLDKYYSIMPKMTLRMALTRLSNKEREHYLTKLDVHNVREKESQRRGTSFFNPEALKESIRGLKAMEQDKSH